jgi:hypothetical protein
MPVNMRSPCYSYLTQPDSRVLADEESAKLISKEMYERLRLHTLAENSS